MLSSMHAIFSRERLSAEGFANPRYQTVAPTSTTATTTAAMIPPDTAED